MNSPRLSIREVNARRKGAAYDSDTDKEEASTSSSRRGLVLSWRGVSNDSFDKDEHFSKAELTEACVHFSIVGVGYLFPFSALTQPVDYWQLLFPDFNIEFPLTTIYMYTNLCMLTLLVLID